MPIRRAYRRRPGRPRGYRKAAGVRRRLRRGLMFRNTRPYFYKQTVNGNAITGILSRFINQTIAPQHLALEFRASDLPQWSTMSGLYDQYCITKIVLKFTPMTTTNPINGTVAGINVSNPGIFASVIDYDDATPLTSLAEYQQYQTFRMTPCITTRSHKRILTPYIRFYNIQTGGASVPATVKKRQWIDCGESNVSHLGLKIYVDPYGTANAPQLWQVFATYYVKFRNVR